MPDTPDNFSLGQGETKAGAQADVYWYMGQPDKERPLYENALTRLRPQLAEEERTRNRYLAYVWQRIAAAELGLGHTAAGLAATAKARAAAAKFNIFGPVVRAYIMLDIADLYATADRSDLAVPLLAKALATPGIGGILFSRAVVAGPAMGPHPPLAAVPGAPEKYARDKPAEIVAKPASS